MGIDVGNEVFDDSSDFLDWTGFLNHQSVIFMTSLSD